MAVSYEPLTVQSLKDACIEKLEALILSGELSVGERLPSERKLAEVLSISRPVVHEALVELAARGIVTIVPRRGVFVEDFRTTGSCAILTSLMSYHKGRLDPAFLESLQEMRLLVESETARLAALHRTPDHLRQVESLLEQEAGVDRTNADSLTELDFAFHQLIAVASANLLYPLILNSFKDVYTNLTRQFFARHQGGPIVEQVFDYHRRLAIAVEAGDATLAEGAMREMLQHGARHLSVEGSDEHTDV